ncbi:MAG: hypothetical protein ACI8S3_001235 [Alphaproteobacteria bacterium]|jgi:uncharacterized protein YbjT (DUF2867 family)
MRILVTGANGITGHTVIRHLVVRGAEVTGLVSKETSQAAIAQLGAAPAVGDLRDDQALRQAMAGAERVYHICPAWVSDEVEIGEAVIAAAQASDISLFGYHSVIAPHLEEIPSHWAKMQVQMALMQCGLPFSVVQPAAYMQNLGQVLKKGELAQPYRVDAPLSWVDVEDVGEAVALLMTKPNQGGGTYELCGTDVPLTTRDIAETLSQSLQQHIEARACPVEDLVQHPPFNGLDAAQLDRLEGYFRFIDAFGMRAGNPNVLTPILGRAPTPFSAIAERLVGRA